MIDYIKYNNKDKDIIDLYGDILCRLIEFKYIYLNIVIVNA